MYIDKLGHVTRMSMDSSVFDEICTLCGATDARNDERLTKPCPKKACPTCLNEFTPDANGNCESCNAIGRTYLGNR